MLYYLTAKFLYILLLTESASTDITPNIIGGDDAMFGQFPALVALRVFTRTYTGLCGGTLIDLSHIITAGHCFDNTKQISDGGRVQAIGDEISLILGSPSRQERNAMFFIVHPKYFHDKYNLFNDVAVVRVSQLFPF